MTMSAKVGDDVVSNAKVDWSPIPGKLVKSPMELVDVAYGRGQRANVGSVSEDSTGTRPNGELPLTNSTIPGTIFRTPEEKWLVWPSISGLEWKDNSEQKHLKALQERVQAWGDSARPTPEPLRAKSNTQSTK
ncbi:MAG: hypothetical protein LBB18_02275 [Puniceicoccales bacterium]|jgi:hypothetical protein|nr:hypothetical protein [Puniceicoccales bacterium]